MGASVINKEKEVSDIYIVPTYPLDGISRMLHEIGHIAYKKINNLAQLLPTPNEIREMSIDLNIWQRAQLIPLLTRMNEHIPFSYLQRRLGDKIIELLLKDRSPLYEVHPSTSEELYKMSVEAD